jgi:hypothetical protein
VNRTHEVAGSIPVSSTNSVAGAGPHWERDTLRLPLFLRSGREAAR